MPTHTPTGTRRSQRRQTHARSHQICLTRLNCLTGKSRPRAPPKHLNTPAANEHEPHPTVHNPLSLTLPSEEET